MHLGRAVISLVGMGGILALAIWAVYPREHSMGGAPSALPALAPKAKALAKPNVAASFHTEVQPLLQKYCYDCHANGASNANISFDTLSDAQAADPTLWLKVLKNIRAGIMPPASEARIAGGDQKAIESWITSVALRSDPNQLDPGRVTLRRLNRTEYHNVIRDLLGIEFDTNMALPPDDVGYGFDNIGDVLSISPIRLEKFIEAAIAVVDAGVPKDTVAMPKVTYFPQDFVDETGRNGDAMSFYRVRTVGKTVHAPAAGDYLIHIYCKIDGEPSPRDPQECRVHVAADGKEFFVEQYHWADNDWFEYDRTVHLEAGDHWITFTTEPVHPELQPLRTKMDYRIVSVDFSGPTDRKTWVHPPGFDRIYTREAPPTDPAERRAYAREVLKRFATRAFRQPVAEETLNHLVKLAEETYTLPDTTFEAGIAHAIVAILASPRFLFHLEGAQPVAPGETYPEVDEYSLASRLSFALWCSMPDDTLMNLAAAGQLRKNFDAQVKRMLADPRAAAFVESFSQQWLQTRAIEEIAINSADIMAQETAPAAAGTGGASPAPVETAPASGPRAGRGVPGAGRAGGRGGRGATYTGLELTPEVRLAMKQEVEAYFAYVLHEDRSVLEFLDSNYTFVNAPLAAVYGIKNVTGTEMRKVELPPDSPRGGVLTMGSVLTVTSNPTRTSPVKRGKWILENILGSPTAPPPPNIPALEDSMAKLDHHPTQREVLAIHRESPMCASCHQRMDPLGLALENFNGFGRFRAWEFMQPIEPQGQLITGETFTGAAELKKALVKNHKLEFYRTLTGKLMTYVLGRGMEYYDVPTIDLIVNKLDADGGRFSTLLMGVLESAPVQRCRPVTVSPDSDPLTSTKGDQ